MGELESLYADQTKFHLNPTAEWLEAVGYGAEGSRCESSSGQPASQEIPSVRLLTQQKMGTFYESGTNGLRHSYTVPKILILNS